MSILTTVSKPASSLYPVSTLMLLTAIAVPVILALIAVNMLLLLISAWLLAYAGIFLLGFGVSQWTSDIAINYYNAVLGVGIQLFTMTFLIGVGKSFLDQYYQAFSVGTPDLNSLCVLLVASVVLLTLANKLPPMLAGIISSGGQTSGIGSFGAGAAIGAGTMAASTVTSAASTALAGANEIAGGTSALTAAFKAAEAHIDSAPLMQVTLNMVPAASSTQRVVRDNRLLGKPWAVDRTQAMLRGWPRLEGWQQVLERSSLNKWDRAQAVEPVQR
ncbi:P-type conjugative transfer protein TrbL [Pseudomonas syringae]|uniref:P-type conjugative transfer protein TrbL n=1 Tax=Pseudomonas syringae TaxID=317 RepID=UPI001EFE3515|nr:P-type conjugative transfer protein TrbL [Pseudomonas syringae]